MSKHGDCVDCDKTDVYLMTGNVCSGCYERRRKGTPEQHSATSTTTQDFVNMIGVRHKYERRL